MKFERENVQIDSIDTVHGYEDYKVVQLASVENNCYEMTRQSMVFNSALVLCSFHHDHDDDDDDEFINASVSNS